MEVFSSKYTTYLCSNIVKRLLIDVFKIQKVRLGCSAHRGQKGVLDPLERELTGCYELPSVIAENQTPILCKRTKNPYLSATSSACDFSAG